MPLFVVEAYTPTEALLPEIEARIRRATPAGAAVCHLRSIYIPGDQTCFHLFTAPTTAHAHAVAERAALEPQRIVEAVERAPGAAKL
jgi:hypothetical protein